MDGDGNEIGVGEGRRGSVREVSRCLIVFCLLFCEEAGEGNDIGVDLLSLDWDVVVGHGDGIVREDLGRMVG